MGSSTHLSTTNLVAAAMPPPTSAARRSTGKRTRPAVTPPPPARHNRGARPTAANRTSPGLPHRTPPAPAMGTHDMPPQPRRAAKRAHSRPPGAAPRSRPPHTRARAAPGRRSHCPPTATPCAPLTSFPCCSAPPGDCAPRNRRAHPTRRRGEHGIGALRTVAASSRAAAPPPHRHLFPSIVHDLGNPAKPCETLHFE